jgi:hypothetical protein
MRHTVTLIALAALAGCNKSQPQQQAQQPVIRVQSEEQKLLKQLDAFNLAIGLKRAIYDAGYTCKQVTDAGFVGTYKNLDMWVAHCTYSKSAARDWAVFAGPDGSAQVRDCKDITPSSGLPACAIKQRPKGNFTSLK